MKTRFLHILLLFVFIGISGFTKAQVTNSEGFESTLFLPANWTAVGNTSLWTRRTTGTNPTCNPHTGLGMARFNSRIPTSLDSTQTITSPVIDYLNRGDSEAPFSFWIYRDTAKVGNYDSLEVLFNTTPVLDGAISLGSIARCALIAIPDTHSVSGWYQYTFYAPFGFNSSSNYFLLKGYNKAGNNIHIDDVSWTSFPSFCEGIPNAGSISSLLSKICDGGGATTLNLSNQTTGFDGLNIQWQSTLDTNGTWMDFGSGTPSILSDSLTSVTYFRVVLGCSFSTLSDTSSVYTIYVSDLPKPIISINPPAPAYCGAAAGAITITASGASSFVWQPATGLDNATSAIVNASPLLTTQYALLGTDDNGCQNILNVNVLVSAPPVLTMSATPPVICVGDSTRIRVFAQGFGGPGGGNIYAWTPGGQTTSNFYDTPITDSQYFVTVTNVAGCVNSDSISVQVLPNLATNFTYTVDGFNVTLNNLSEGDTATIWDMGNGDMLNSHNATYTYALEGTYDVTLISLGNCHNDTLVQSITVGPAGFEAISNANKLQVYPNPVNNVLSVSFVADSPDASLSIINELGQVINRIQLKTNSGQIQNQNIDLSNIPSGIYMIKIDTSNNRSTLRFVKN